MQEDRKTNAEASDRNELLDTEPDIYTGAEAWILAGGAHHTAFTYDLTAEQMGDWAAAMGIEAVYIDKDTKIRDFKRDLMLGEVFYR